MCYYIYTLCGYIGGDILLKSIISKRRVIQGVVGLSLYVAIGVFNISLWYIIIFGSLLGIIFGKVFCRWICPVGFIMELIMGRNPDSSMQQMYMYHKLGCPIAWISGLLNKHSLFKIKRNTDTCLNCGKCDKVCYISTLNKDYSLYKNKKLDPSTHFSCSKCLQCVDTCPNGSLTFKN